MPNDEPREGKPKTHLEAAIANLKDAATKPNAATYLHGAVAEIIEHLLILQDRRDSAGGEGKVEGDRPADWYRCRVYKGDSRHKEYLEARFPKDGPHTAPFVFEGHRWQYEMTSWDDMGEYDLLVRPPDYLDHSRQPARGEMRDEIESQVAIVLQPYLRDAEQLEGATKRILALVQPGVTVGWNIICENREFLWRMPVSENQARDFKHRGKLVALVSTERREEEKAGEGNNSGASEGATVGVMPSSDASQIADNQIRTANPQKGKAPSPAPSDPVEELAKVIYDGCRGVAKPTPLLLHKESATFIAKLALRWFHSRQPARGEMRENRHEGKAAANDLAERDELRQESARPVHDGGSGQSKPTLVRNDVPLPTLAQGFLNVETREVILGASGPYSPQWVEFVAVPLDAWHAASHKHLDALLSPRGDGWKEAKAVTEAFRELNNAIACVSSPEYGRLCNAFHALHEAVRLSRPAAKEPLRVPIDPVYPKNSVEERAYYVACIRRDLKLANVTDWNLTRLLDLHEVETAFLRAQNRELSKGTEALVLEMSNWKNRYDQACIEIERMKKAK